MARVNRPVQWEEMDGELVRFILMLAIPEKETGSKSLRMLSSLSEKLMEVEFREALLYLERTKFPFFRRKVRDDRA